MHCLLDRSKVLYRSVQTDVRLPRWDELFDEQLEVWEYPLDRSLFVVGPPGSGKTALAIRRAESAVGFGQPVAVITYNRMLRRLLAQVGRSLTVSTMHSFVWKHYRSLTRGHEPPSLDGDPYHYDWSSMLNRIGKRSRGVVPNGHLIVDEGQDLPVGFFEYASRHLATNLTVFSDEFQAISVHHSQLEQIKSAAGLADPVILKVNHRNCPEVARLAHYFHRGRLRAATIRRRGPGNLPRLVRLPDFNSKARLISNWYRNRGGTVGVIVNSKSFSRALYRKLVDNLPKARVDYYDSSERNEDSIDLLKPGVTVLNKRSVKGQEFNAVFVMELEAFIPCAEEVDRRVMYMLCSRARDDLFLVHGPDALTTEAAQSLPGPDLLERQ